MPILQQHWHVAVQYVARQSSGIGPLLGVEMSCLRNDGCRVRQMFVQPLRFVLTRSAYVASPACALASDPPSFPGPL